MDVVGSTANMATRELKDAWHNEQESNYEESMSNGDFLSDKSTGEEQKGDNLVRNDDQSLTLTLCALLKWKEYHAKIFVQIHAKDNSGDDDRNAVETLMISGLFLRMFRVKKALLY